MSTILFLDMTDDAQFHETIRLNGHVGQFSLVQNTPVFSRTSLETVFQWLVTVDLGKLVTLELSYDVHNSSSIQVCLMTGY